MIHVWTLTSWMEYLLTPSRSVATVTRPPNSASEPQRRGSSNSPARVQQQARAGPATSQRQSSNKPAPVQQEARVNPASRLRSSKRRRRSSNKPAAAQQQTDASSRLPAIVLWLFPPPHPPLLMKTNERVLQLSLLELQPSSQCELAPSRRIRTACCSNRSHTLSWARAIWSWPQASESAPPVRHGLLQPVSRDGRAPIQKPIPNLTGIHVPIVV